MNRLAYVIAAILVLAGVFVRAWGLFTDLWIDEIFSIAMARNATSAINLATVYKFQHDNNHILNTVFVYFIDPFARDHLILYRMFAFACGMLALPLAWSLGRRCGERSAILAVVFIATWYQFAHFSSEARGYAPMLTFVLLAWWSLERFLERGRWYHALIFVAASMLGFLSHFTFIFASAGLGFLSLRGGWKNALALNLIPLAFIYMVYDEFIRIMRPGRGPRIGILGAVYQYSDQTLGVVAIPIIALCVIGVIRYLKYDGWVLAAIIVSIVIVSLFRDMTYVYGRYFIAFTPFLLILMARWMASWTSRDAVIAVVALWVAGQASMTIPFLEYGRGPYRQALAYMTGRTVASEYPDDFHDRSVLAFYRANFSRQRPDFLTSAVFADMPRELDRYGAHYVYDRKFPFQGISGTPWHIWRRQDADPATPSAPATAPSNAVAHN